MSVAADEQWMARAIELAELGRYGTAPNPVVGCVIVAADGVVGEGCHRQAGGPHAEVVALEAAGERARGATLYASLEPCCHHGKTPPCTDAVVAAGITRVVVAGIDPNPLVAGQGIAALRAGGVVVEVGVLADAAAALNPGFIKRMRFGRPYVRLKMAASLDGRVALASGESRWISGAAARRDVQRQRARCGAIVTGIGTVIADDPALTARLPDLVLRPLRVLVDSKGRCPAKAQLLTDGGPTLWVTAGPAAAEQNSETVRRITLESADGRVDLDALLDWLAGAGVNEVLVEAGPILAGSFIDKRLVDEMILYVGACLLGPSGRPLVDIAPVQSMRERPEFELLEVARFDDDVRLCLRPRF